MAGIRAPLRRGNCGGGGGDIGGRGKGRGWGWAGPGRGADQSGGGGAGACCTRQTNGWMGGGCLLLKKCLVSVSVKMVFCTRHPSTPPSTHPRSQPSHSARARVLAARMQCAYRADANIARARPRPITTKRLTMSRATAIGAGAGDVAVADATGASKKIATRMAEYPVAGTFDMISAAWAAVGRAARASCSARRVHDCNCRCFRGLTLVLLSAQRTICVRCIATVPGLLRLGC
jgi:hypothetical protein